jgi:hypothetical protein
MGVNSSALCRSKARELEKWVIYIQHTDENTMTPVQWTTYTHLQNIVTSKWGVTHPPTFVFMDGTGVPKSVDDQESFGALIPRFLNIEDKVDVYYVVAQLVN